MKTVWLMRESKTHHVQGVFSSIRSFYDFLRRAEGLKVRDHVKEQIGTVFAGSQYFTLHEGGPEYYLTKWEVVV